MSRLGRAMSVIFPWPDRHQRRQAVAAATAEKDRSVAGAEHAAALEQQIRRMAAENHFAERIAGQIIRRHSGEG